MRNLLIKQLTIVAVLLSSAVTVLLLNAIFSLLFSIIVGVKFTDIFSSAPMSVITFIAYIMTNIMSFDYLQTNK